MYDFDPTTNSDVCRKIANVLTCPLKNVQTYYPLLYADLKANGLVDRFEIIIALATIGTESSTFDFTVKERSSKQWQIDHYWKRENVRKNLGNTKESDAWMYCGRGPLQLTGRYNYTKYGKLIGIDILNTPDLASVPTNAVKLFRAYFKDHGVDVWANRWAGHDETALQKCRKLVNGGLNGYDRFKKLAAAFLALG